MNERTNECKKHQVAEINRYSPMEDFIVQLDSTCWFSHRRDRVADDRTALLIYAPPRTAPEKCRTFFLFLSTATLTFDLWLWHSNSGKIFVQCTQRPSVIILRLIVPKSSC